MMSLNFLPGKKILPVCPFLNDEFSIASKTSELFVSRYALKWISFSSTINVTYSEEFVRYVTVNVNCNGIQGLQ